MFIHCIHCAGNFGQNESLEAFPVGKRIAYDSVPSAGQWEESLVEVERAWRDAEVVAAIADNLLVPAAVEQALSGRRRPMAGGTGATSDGSDKTG